MKANAGKPRRGLTITELLRLKPYALNAAKRQHIKLRSIKLSGTHKLITGDANVSSERGRPRQGEPVTIRHGTITHEVGENCLICGAMSTEPTNWTMVDVNGKPVMPLHDTNVGNWLHEYQIEPDSNTPRFWRMR